MAPMLVSRSVLCAASSRLVWSFILLVYAGCRVSTRWYPLFSRGIGGRVMKPGAVYILTFTTARFLAEPPDSSRTNRKHDWSHVLSRFALIIAVPNGVVAHVRAETNTVTIIKRCGFMTASIARCWARVRAAFTLTRPMLVGQNGLILSTGGAYTAGGPTYGAIMIGSLPC